jgi:hypothetical protein
MSISAYAYILASASSSVVGRMVEKDQNKLFLDDKGNKLIVAWILKSYTI